MKNNLSCEIVEDLLPSYIDGLTGEVTNTAIREHLSRCEKCKATMEAMAEPYTQTKIAEEKKEIDFLKKTRRKNIKSKIFSILSVILILAIVSVSIPFTRNYTLMTSELYCDLAVVDDSFIFTAAAKDSDFAIRNVEHKIENGVLEVYFIAGKRAPFNSKKFFKWEYPSKDVLQVEVSDEIIWAKGEHISSITSDVYLLKTPYIGDMSHNSMIASALNIREHLGTFTNALTTSKEPYAWEIVLSNPIVSQNIDEKRELMTAYAYVLLAVIGNLSEVKFSYDAITDEGNTLELFQTVTKQMASDYVGKDIKKCGENINELQLLMKKTGLADMPYIDNENHDNIMASAHEMVEIDIFNATDETIKRVEVYCKELDNYVANGLQEKDFSLNLFASSSIYSTMNLSFMLENLNGNLYSKERLGKLHLQVSIYDDKGNIYEIEPEIVVSAGFGAIYSYNLTGSFTDGFKLSQ